MAALTLQQALDLALQHHQAGRLQEAENLYRQILAIQPTHAQAWQLFGVIAHQAGQHALALERIQHALALQPNSAAANINLGEVLRALGKKEEAVAAYQRALQLHPNHPDALYNLGNVWREQGRWAEAATTYRKALQARPDSPEVLHNLACVHMEERRFDEAIELLQRALAVRPHFPQALNNLASALVEQGRREEAISVYQHALQLQANFPEAWNNLGSALRASGRIDEAVVAFRQAIRLNPALLEALESLGELLNEQRRFGEAVDVLRRALEIKPDRAHAWHRLGLALSRMDRPDESLAAYERALALEPNDAAMLNNLASVLLKLDRLDDATAAFRQAMALRPDMPEAACNLAWALMAQARPAEAIPFFREAIWLEPKNVWQHSDLLIALSMVPDLTPQEMALELDRWNWQFGMAGKTKAFSNSRDPERRLRIGYVSPDFRDHVVGRNIWPLFQHHDHERFEIFCYSQAVNLDAMTEKFRGAADQWRETAGVNDEEVVEMIRRDGIDILVDLAQHTAGHRLVVFAHRAAPVQVSFAGYPASSGVQAIEYRLSDRWLEGEAPEIDGRKSTEKVLFLESFWCYDPCGMDVAVNALPAEKRGFVTFGCLNSFYKINDSVLRLWAEVLAAVPDSHLLLLTDLRDQEKRVTEFLAQHGIDPQRLEFVRKQLRRGYLETYRRIDVVLDTFPYNGHTTDLDALWMGVPVVSLVRASPFARAGLSVLNNLGLPELAVFSEADYVRVAKELAGDRRRLAELRATLRARMEASVLMDATKFARGIEEAFRAMWREWCGGSESDAAPVCRRATDAGGDIGDLPAVP